MPLPPNAHMEGKTLVVDEPFFPRATTHPLPLAATPIFLRLAHRHGAQHAVWAMIRGQRVKANGPTPRSTSMERTVLRERFGPLFTTDEHSPDL